MVNANLCTGDCFRSELPSKYERFRHTRKAGMYPAFIYLSIYFSFFFSFLFFYFI